MSDQDPLEALAARLAAEGKEEDAALVRDAMTELQRLNSEIYGLQCQILSYQWDTLRM